MFQPKSYLLIVILGILSLVTGACAESPAQTMTAAPLEVPKEGRAVENILTSEYNYLATNLAYSCFPPLTKPRSTII